LLLRFILKEIATLKKEEGRYPKENMSYCGKAGLEARGRTPEGDSRRPLNLFFKKMEKALYKFLKKF
jgi:hypothetical protein